MAKNSIMLWECGGKASMKINPAIECLITGILVRFGQIEYELQWFNGTVETRWFKPEEIIFGEGKQIQIGFISGQK